MRWSLLDAQTPEQSLLLLKPTMQMKHKGKHRVFVSGEFGRTPKINQRGGRGHYPRAMFCLLAAGGIKGGKVVGESGANGERPKDKPITTDDVAATFYHTLGIDHTKEYHTPSGRPVMIVRHNKLIRDLLG